MGEYQWKTVSVIGFDELMRAMDRADHKGYMPDAIKEEWEAFNWGPPQRKPLTYVDLRRIANQCGLGANEVSARTQATVDNFARAIEAAHGIKENT